MPPQRRELYEWAKEYQPGLYEILLSMDAHLAELHAAGMDIQRQRLYYLEEIAKAMNTPTHLIRERF